MFIASLLALKKIIPDFKDVTAYAVISYCGRLASRLVPFQPQFKPPASSNPSEERVVRQCSIRALYKGGMLTDTYLDTYCAKRVI